MSSKKYIDSGILKMYILGYANETETKEIESLMLKDPELMEEIEKIQIELEEHVGEISVAPHSSLKPLVLATFDYMKRLENGEQPVSIPELNENSKVQDFEHWINREDLHAPTNFDDIYVKILSANPQMTCAIVWIKEKAMEEVHTDEYEKFFILEGTCTIMVGTQENKLVAGDYFAIPLYENHQVLVTSDIPCKVILQRVAA